ncbi:type VI secretion system lipoprotein TssJ [Roseibium sp. Sym1]|uniref:type VI secretion system lipoprotein TssJ n=1 Tax=Roseibium sp. Sym1 TaxID=3016006 RepID=UPI0022B48EE1|nr:type VI secretion system lipoprotein TssJ [Roseibium sp. Sym1]
MTVTRRNFLEISGVGLLAGLAACSRVPPPTPIKVQLQADEYTNPNENGDPSPVVVRVYQLKEVTAFQNAEYFDLADNDKKVLGGDLIGVQEYEMTPGKSQDYNRDVSSEATHIGVIASFRDIENAQWRDSIELKQEKKNEFVIYLTTLAVRIQKLRSRRLGVF